MLLASQRPLTRTVGSLIRAAPDAAGIDHNAIAAFNTGAL